MDVKNLPQLQRVRAEALGPRVAVRYKKHGLYRDLAWGDYRAQVEACAAALVSAGIKPGDRVGLLSENRVEWLIADLGIMAAGAVNVPLHAPLAPKQAQFQLSDGGAGWLFVSNLGQLEKIRANRAELPLLRGVVIFDAESSADAIPWRSFIQQGRIELPKRQEELRRREQDLGPDDLATIMYTSGTTGNPKGVMLTHNNLVSNARAFGESSPTIGMHSVMLNWLPFSHIYARTVDHYMHVWLGSTLCLAESAETLVQNLAEIKPTNMSSVPRFYEKVLSSVAGAAPDDAAKRLRALFGPRIDWLGSGGAPLPLAIAQAYEKAGVLLLQGYGLTESSPVISYNRKHQYKLASVGPPLPGIEVKIADDGELLTRGPHVMKGYWNNPGATAEALQNGWLHTGDLARLDDDGFLHITGRKKELLVLSNGKKVVPPYLEGLLLAEPCIDQAVIYGEGKNFLTALIVPQWGNLRKALPDANGPEEALADDPKIRAFLESRIDQCLTEVAPWEQIKKIVVLASPFSVANEELTVSLKLRRTVILEKHRKALEGLYQGNW